MRLGAVSRGCVAALREDVNRGFGAVDRRFDGVHADIGRLQDAVREHGDQLKGHRRLLEEHGCELKEHRRLLEEHGRELKDHRCLLEEHGAELRKIRAVIEQ
jgi:hypothetical protein